MLKSKNRLAPALMALAMCLSLVMLAACTGGAGQTTTVAPTTAAPTTAAPVTEAPTTAAPAQAAAPTTAAPAPATPSGGTKVYLVTMDQMDQHWANVDAGCRKAVDELRAAGQDIDYTWQAPDVKDDAKQIEVINNAVAAGANVLLLAANGPNAVTSALEEAVSKGVKIIYVDSPADFPAEQTLSTDNTAAGKTAGETMLEALAASGVSSGTIGIVNVNSSTASVVARETGFRSAFDGTGFSILETQYAEGDVARSKDAATNFITEGVVGLFGANEGSTTGVGNAIAGAGKAIVGVGFDNSSAIQELIADGNLLATMAQNPDVMGYEGMLTAAKVLKGES
ncbi:MAG: substrate-binding domain-containing protein, partial [Clostridiales bacterium]|nr:substrate-binding domain-containing protein [Clostridiales bacterium]